ncbi:hypothetical protein ACJMK2_039139 [Sinanodonta woodiana]|uniref:Uncharacterized protein n=1 Tax=Sinanodonta woodiana TaxID=1069815 RepID=A0ABD3WF01_SINWO
MRPINIVLKLKFECFLLQMLHLIINNYEYHLRLKYKKMIFLLWRLFYIDYVVVCCKKNGHPTPLESSLIDAITERISYARKQIKMTLKKQKY